ncbi:type II secretion system protein G (GspG) [Terriglobus roseus]|uniref:Type II secretion system protein G (GspG) n=2 Tax=Terriglobus roseus TaxID=392734 RepID=A0A1G7JP88_9BACT|nr:prepilin-type N-terminal cleavage/methylation domain-containing protein [Terriglobus roseus]SDF26289.1 type II secretion system protein G (GspG) [Terriglobus roseus]
MVTMTKGHSNDEGFTLLELLFVMVIIGVLAAMAVPAYTRHLRAAKEAVLKQDLHVMREAIDSYTVDKQKAPQTLDDLVTAGYLKALPMDPITNRKDSWMGDRTDSYNSVDETQTGINDVHSGAQNASLDGSLYSTW